MNPKNYYTPREVEKLIPKLESIFDHVRVCRSRAMTLAAEWRELKGGTNPGQIAQEQLLRSQVDFLLEAVQDDVEYVARLGGVTKDLERGLVDFPGQMDGEEVWLCWKRGETRVVFWHALDQGYEDRQTLPRNESSTVH